MLNYGISLASVGGLMTPELAAAFRRSTLSEVEVNISPLERNDEEGGSGRSLTMELLAEGTIRARSLHLPFGKDWDISYTDETERKQAMDKQRDIIERNSGFGAQYLTLHASWEPIEPADRQARLEQVCKSIEELLPCIQGHDMRLSVELLPRTCIGNHEDELLEIVSRFDPEVVGICLDVNHAMNRYAELASIIDKIKDRLFTLHISDYDGVDEKHWFPGQGIIDWSAVIDALKKTERELYLFYETKYQLSGADPIFGLRQVENSIEFLETCRGCNIRRESQ